MTMRSLLFVVFCFLLSPVGAQPMRDVLKRMPSQLVPYLTENAWLDFIDFKDSGMRAEVANQLEGKSVLLSLTDDYASIALSESSRLDLRLLDVAEPVDSAQQIICAVFTYGTDVRESTIGFYSRQWRRLDASERVDLPDGMCILTLGEKESTLTITPECRLDAPANEEQEEIVKTSISLKWNTKRFNKY